ncbi:hypothetical protein RHGRI_030787 [Rhododendron griersonianum]|uniref:Aminotransferase-like plant mobile domain-containing protein n=1 Tax=Rhododendron griersonianum TaxID=479676 RepID=A0AAV6I8J5_9ERIC|nr:hypothetical protein RHGRI_030787 [Rhododendron griersonianum]
MAPKKGPKITSHATQVAQILEGEETHIHTEVLIPQEGAKSEMALGPAFDGEFPASLFAYYPLAEDSLPFDSVVPNWTCYYKPNPNRLWPRPNKEYIAWLDRVAEAKGNLWEIIGIHDAIMLSRSFIPMDKALFFAAAQFWSATSNSFLFKVGMMGPTLQDVCFLTGLRAHGVEADCFLSQATPVFDRITKDFTDLAKALASGREIAMAPLVLAYVYRGMRDLLENQYVFAAGPLWVMTLWLWAYFPTLGPALNKNPDHTCYGLHYLDLSPRDHTFEACFKYFYSDLVSMGEGWMPFERDTVPDWLEAFPGEAGDEGGDHKKIWASFLVSRDLLFGLSAQSRNDKKGSDKARASFDFRPYSEFPEKSNEFASWWRGYIKPLFSKPVGKVLKDLALPPPPEPKKGSAKAKATSVTSSKRKGFEEEEDEEVEQTPAPKKVKRSPMPTSKATTGKDQTLKASKTAIADRTRASASKSPPEGSPPTVAKSKGSSKGAKAIVAKTPKPQDLVGGDSSDSTGGSETTPPASGEQGFGARDQLRTEINEAKTKRAGLLTSIQTLETELSKTRQQLADHEQHEASLVQRRQELLDAAQGPLSALQLLMVEKPKVEASRDQAEVVINDAVTAWDSLKATLESEL